MDDLRQLTLKHEHATTIYIPTTALPTAKKENQLTLKAAIDEITDTLKRAGTSKGVIEGLATQWRFVNDDDELWRHLSASLAVFLTPENAETYVLPNRLNPSRQLGDRFDIGQLLRSVTYPHEAYALTLSSNAWDLWHATAEERVKRIETTDDHPGDAAEANNKLSIRGRGHTQRLVGDEGKKIMLDRYALRVSNAVKAELNRLKVGDDVPLFVFATEPLLGMFGAYDPDAVRIPGAPGALKPEQIDETIREHLDEFYAHQVVGELDAIADDTAAGLAATKLEDIARAAAAGQVGTLLFNFAAEVYGTLDEQTGAISVQDRGSQTAGDADDNGTAVNLLSAIAVLALAHGGRVLAIRDEEAGHSIWNHVAVAHLRHALN